MKDFSAHLIYSHQPIKFALDRLNTLSDKKHLTLFVLNDQDQLVGTIADGDIRRGILNNLGVTEPVEKFMFREFGFIRRNESDLEKLAGLENRGIKLLPVLDEDSRITRIVDLTEKKCVLPVDAVIMAGGRGERLRPLTDKTPKPLLKVGDKPIIEHDVDRLSYFGVHTIYIAVNYLADQLLAQMGNGQERGLDIRFLEEKEPLGTIGALSLVPAFGHDSILVMNSDLLTNIDLKEFYQAFKQADADMAIATIPYQVNIPYGVVNITGNKVHSFAEKPTHTYHCSAGIYLLKKHLAGLVPPDTHFNATDLIDEALSKGFKVTSFPILGYWLDIGKAEDYQRAQEDIRYLKM